MRKYLLIICLAVIVSYIFSHFHLYSVSSLSKKPDLICLKSLLEKQIMGGEEFAADRVTVSRNRLKLNAWHGHNAVLYNHPIMFQEIDFDYVFYDDENYFSIVFNYNKSGHYGFRISNSTAFSSVFYQATPSGKFIFKQEINLTHQKGWNHIRIIYQDTGFTIYLNGAQIKTDPITSPRSSGYAGLLGGPSEELYIDNLHLRGEESEILETFSNEGSKLVPFFFSLLFLFLITLFVFTLKRIFTGLDLVSTCFMIFIDYGLIISSFYIFDYYYWSTRYYYEEPQVGSSSDTGLEWNLEQFRLKLFSKLDFDKPKQKDTSLIRSTLLGDPSLQGKCHLEQIFKDISDLKLSDPYVIKCLSDENIDNTYRLAFVGTSQTFGAGASYLNQSFVPQFAGRIFNSINQNCNLHFYNMSIRGSNSEELYGIFKDQLTSIKPEIVFLNILTNDPEDLFYPSMKQLIKLLLQSDIRVVLIQEPTKPRRWNKRKRELLRDLALEHKLLLWDAKAFINSTEIYDSGYLWRDFIHFSQYGHDLLAEWLFRNFQQLERPSSCFK